MQIRGWGRVAGATLAVVVLATGAASAQQVGDEMRLDFTLSIGGRPIADYQSEFSTAGFPAGFQYLSNTAGPLGNPANYTPLTLTGGQYTVPGTRLAIGQSTPDPVSYPPAPLFPALPLTFVRPGAGSLEDPAGIERAAIIAYTIQSDDLAGAAGPVPVAITAYDFAVSSLATPDGMSARVYRSNSAAPLLDFSDDTLSPFLPGFRFETSLDPEPIPLGSFNVGDTIYFALGANNVAVPEPGLISLLAPAGLLLTRRRRN